MRSGVPVGNAYLANRVAIDISRHMPLRVRPKRPTRHPSHDADMGCSTISDALEIRHVRTHDEFVQCVELEAATWGAGFRESVPATILKITQRLGGVTAGAFAPDGALVGFVFGITGVERGELVHWSDMLAVAAGAQNHGIGRRLKEFQRDAVGTLGVTRMYWTYDPLVSRNAHFNLNLLGARVVEYVRDMYGADTGSTLHQGLGSDRFIVVWPITPEPESASRATPPAEAWQSSPIINGTPAGGTPADLAVRDDAAPSLARVEIPSDILAVQQRRIAEAVAWRESTRSSLQWALTNGYRIAGFQRDSSSDRNFYLLARDPAAAAFAPT